MAIRYLYIDDEANSSDSVPTGIIRNLSIGNKDVFHIELEPALSWNKQLTFIIDNIAKYNGILLDLRLEFSSDNDKILHYAPALAQELRSLTKRGIIKDLPIFLCSTDNILRSSYDTTSEDLFDECFTKTELTNRNYKIYFLDHTRAYQIIAKNDSLLNTLLGIKNVHPEFLNDIIQYHDQLETVHAKAKFLLRQVIEPPGILIDEELLAIRLGIDKDKSGKSWNDIKNELALCQYSGIYKEAYPRWWMHGLLNWWNEKVPLEKNPILLSAEQRVTALKRIGFENLVHLVDIEHHQSTKYWYKCANYLLEDEFEKKLIPVADGDGFEFLPPKYPWLDINIISKYYSWEEGSQEPLHSIKKKLSPYFIEDLEEMIEKRDNL